MQRLETSAEGRDSVDRPIIRISSPSNIFHVHQEAYPWKAREKRACLMSARSDKRNAKQRSGALSTVVVLKAPLNSLEGNLEYQSDELTLLATGDDERAGQQQA